MYAAHLIAISMHGGTTTAIILSAIFSQQPRQPFWLVVMIVVTLAINQRGYLKACWSLARELGRQQNPRG